MLLWHPIVSLIILHECTKYYIMSEHITIQSNDITHARSVLNIYERRIVNAIIDNLSSEIREMANYRVQAISYRNDNVDADSIIMKFRASDIVKHDRYKELRDALVGLKSKAVYIEKKDGTRITGFLNWGELPIKSEIVTLSVDKVFYNTLFDLTKGYTIFQARVLNSLTSVHATKLYGPFASWRDRDFMIISVQELRRLTRDCLDKHLLYANFKARVLEIALKQLNDNRLTDIRFSYKELKKGKTVESIKFSIIKTENAHELSQQRNRISPYWDFTKDLVNNCSRLGINLKGKNLELFKEYKNIFGEQRLATDLNLFINEAKSKSMGIPYVIGIMKNKIVITGQTSINFNPLQEKKR